MPTRFSRASSVLALCTAMCIGCAGDDRASCDEGAVCGYGSTEDNASSSAILSANGSYGSSCAGRANGTWSVPLTMGAPLDNAPLAVANNNVACTLSLVSLRTGSGASNLYTASSPIVLTASYPSAVLFSSPADSLSATAKLSSLAFLGPFTLTVLVSDDVQLRDAGASTFYSYEARVLGDTPLSYWRLDDTTPAALATDGFSGSASTTLQSRVGAPITWTKHSASGTDAILSASARARVNTNRKAVYLAGTAPGSADYVVSADVYVASLLANDQAGVLGRALSANETYYYAGLVESVVVFQFRRFELWKYVGGVGLQLGYVDDTSTAGSTHRVSLEMRGTSIRASLDGTERIAVTDSSISAAGSAGLLLGTSFGSTQSDSAGLHLDNASLRAVSEVHDSKGTNHGRYTNGVTLGATGAITVPNAAVTFDGVDDYAEVTRQISNDFSIELWFKSTQGLGAASVTQWAQTAGLVDAYAAISNTDFGIGLRSDGRILAGTGKTSCVVPLVCGDDDQNIISGGATAYNDGAWHQVVFTRTKAAGAMVLYVDGASRASLNSGGATHTLDATVNLSIGRIQTGTNYFAGSIDEVSVYATVLSAQSVLNHYRAGRSQ